MEKPKKISKRILSWPQILIILAVVAALGLAVDLTSKAQAGREQLSQDQSLSTMVEAERERNRQLKVTLTYVYSNDYAADYARNEAGMILPGEKRIVPLPHPLPLTPTPIPTPVPLIIVPDEPWQAWWMLFFDSPPPGRQPGGDGR
jgi:cell division protein FtsB